VSDDAARRLRGRFTRRTLLIGGAQAGLFALLLQRLHQIQVIDADELAERGDILDRFGVTLASNREDLRISIVPGLTPSVDETLRMIAEIVPISAETAERARRLSRRQSAHVPILVADRLTWRQFALVNLLAPQLPGVLPERGSARIYRDARSAAHILGYVGAAGKDRIAEDPVMRVPGFRIGMAGVEQGFDRDLRGEPGAARIEVDARGRGVRGLGETSRADGGALVLTIDRAMQDVASKRIEKERRASVVALDAESGDVLVMASHPGFDPNDLVRDITPDTWRELVANKDKPLGAKAVQGQYPPGSTFKMVTALAGLEAGLITPRTRIRCPGAFHLGRARFGCWKRGGHGSVDLHDAIKQSCDVYFYETAHRLGIDRLAAMARRFGCGEAFGIGLPEEKAGVVPDAAWKRATMGQPWYGGETVIAGIGQGFVLTTVLQLAVMTARLATGRAIVPRIAMNAGPAHPFPAELGLDPAHLAAVQAGMDGVVNEPGGTAGRSKLELENVRMAGKTGTSQVTRLSVGRHYTSMPYHLRDHALFVAYAPVERPRYAVACVVEHGGGGSHAAAPMVKDVMTALLQRDPLALPTHQGDGVAPGVSAASHSEQI
jgi:penicillin-binding protein 2